jgi:hypothetical protein
MQRVKNISYDEDDLYSDDEEYNTQQTTDDYDEYTPEDRANFANLTPVVHAELSEAGLQASDREVQDALWHYYWDVGKSVAYLKNTRTPRTKNEERGKKGAVKDKAKSKFDQAVERSANVVGVGGEFGVVSLHVWEDARLGSYEDIMRIIGRRGGSNTHLLVIQWLTSVK